MSREDVTGRFNALGLAALALLALLAAGCSSGSDDSVPADAQRVAVTVGDALLFDPRALTLQAGKPVALTVKNIGNTDHDFTVMEMDATNVKNKIDGGESHTGHSMAGVVVGHPKKNGEVTIQFTPTRPGTYEFYCSVTGHREAGMKGVLTVT
jgi:uncharacterized cupredoxin-like copper-binding protein